MLKLRLLGPFYAEFDGTFVEGFVSAKVQALLCYLALSEKVHSRQALAGLFWADAPEDKALGALRVALSNLRKLAPGCLESSRTHVIFRRDQPYWIDVEEVAGLLKPVKAADRASLKRALGLLRGDFLEDLYIDGVPEFEQWLFGQRAYWQRVTLEILSRLATYYLAERRYEDAAAILRRSLHLEPWDEAAHRQLMESLARTGDFNAALAQYETCQRTLEEELGVEPMPETTALYRRIQAARRQAAYALPQDDAPFVGRQRELARIEDMLADPRCRLLTVVGLGGSGKTRLALAVAQRAGDERSRQFLNGVVFVPLAATKSPANLPSILAGALGLLLEGKDSPAERVLEFLGDKELLLVLDNFEHLAGEIGFVQRLVQNAPDVKVLVSSREPLRLQAEWRVDLEGMRYPQLNGGGAGAAARVIAFEAVELFVQSARQARPDFSLDDVNAADVVRVCQLVAGMPLGVKLAAAWSRAMSPAEIASEVAQSMDFLADQYRDLPWRQHSVRAVFESTWARLPETDRHTFAALYVFCGGFTAGAAAEVVSLDLNQLLALVDRGLVQRLGRGSDGERYDLHPLMRQFAGEKLAEGNRFDDIAGRHSRHYLTLAAAREGQLFGPAPQETVSALRLELDNLHQAWQWAADHQQFQLLHDAAGALAALFEFAVLFAEGAQAFASVVQQLERQPAGATRDAVLCKLIAHQISLTLDRGITDVAASMERHETLARRLNDGYRLPDLHLLQGRLVERLQGFHAAVAHYERAAVAYEALDRPRHLAKALNSLGFALANLGRSAEGLRQHRRSYQIARALDDVRLQVLALTLMGLDSHYLSRHQEALAFWEEALAQYVQLRDDLAILRTSNNICYVQSMLGNYDEALQVAERLQSLIVRVADHVSESDAHDTLGDIYFSLGDYGQARYHYMHAIENAHTGRVRLKEAWCLTGLAELDIASGRYGLAESHLERAQSLYHEDDHPRDRARFLAAVGELNWRSGRREKAIDCYMQVIEGMEDGGEPIYMSPLLVRAGRFFLEVSDLPRAQALLQRGLTLAQSIGRKPTILQARLLLAQLAHRKGEQNAAQTLEALLATARRDAERADVLYALWQTTREPAWGMQALAVYRRLAAETPDVMFAERREALEGEIGGLETGDRLTGD